MYIIHMNPSFNSFFFFFLGQRFYLKQGKISKYILRALVDRIFIENANNGYESLHKYLPHFFIVPCEKFLLYLRKTGYLTK